MGKDGKSVIRGYMAMIVRKWHKHDCGTYEQFRDTYSKSDWLPVITRSVFNSLKTAPVKRPLQENSKRKYNVRKPRNVNKIYMSMWRKDKDEIGANGVALIREILEVLSRDNKSQLELVEYIDPPIVELRQYSN